MHVHVNTGGLASTNCYLVADDATRQAVLFDAPDHTTGPLLDRARSEGYDLIGLWLTHGHFDHVADHAVVTKAFPKAQVLLHALDVPMLKKPAVQSTLFMLPFEIPPREPDQLIEDGQTLNLGSLEVRVIHTPGHAPGHIMYHFPTEKVLVGGDLIICGAVGRTDLPGCDERQLIESIRKVYRRCPPETRLLPGHCEESTLAHELETNPFVRAAVGAR
jgi:glyoxylase-like metal-dependent hydrolase (beta-lactamase superfamily II)